MQMPQAHRVPPAPNGRVVAVVPLFEPNDSVQHALRTTRDQVDHLVLADDGSTRSTSELVVGVARDHVHLLRSTENAGIAHALNQGITYALTQLQADFVLTLDQDSILEAGYVTAALGAVEELDRRRIRYLAVGAGLVNGVTVPGTPQGAVPCPVTHETNQSGLLFPATALRENGSFDETLFIDCVDTDYILRGAVRGRPTVIVAGCSMQHSVGRAIDVSLPPPFRRRHRRVPYHDPTRRYYISRNRLRLVRRFARHRPGWAVWQTSEQMKLALGDIVFGPDPLGHLIATVLGWWDGIFSRGGRISDRRAAQIARRRIRV